MTVDVHNVAALFFSQTILNVSYCPIILRTSFPPRSNFSPSATYPIACRHFECRSNCLFTLVRDLISIWLKEVEEYDQTPK